jgi:hypothetical protein
LAWSGWSFEIICFSLCLFVVYEYKTNTANTALPLDVKDSGWKLMSQTPVGWSCGGLSRREGLETMVKRWNMVKHGETVAAVVAVLCISWRPTRLLRTAPFAIELFAVETECTFQSDKVLGNVVNVFFLFTLDPLWRLSCDLRGCEWQC